jgi:glycosyltransferase involved in cell wall biosynthesis
MVDILLATYNGEKYLHQQIDSIINQTYNNWRIIVRDDCSSDDTIRILLKYKKKLKERLIIIKNGNQNLGPAFNFIELLKNSSSPYCMFCDQDDYWLPDKIELSVNKLNEYPGVPALVYTDLEVVDWELKKMDISSSELKKTTPGDLYYKNIIIHNKISGCTVIINSELRKIALSGNIDYIIMHDWYLAVIASLCGIIGYIDKPTILYRQHQNNTIGVKIKNFAYWKNKITNIDNNSWNKKRRQVENILNLCDIVLPKSVMTELSEFGKLNEYSKIKRIYWHLSHKYYTGTPIEKLGQLYMLIMPGECQ